MFFKLCPEETFLCYSVKLKLSQSDTYRVSPDKPKYFVHSIVSIDDSDEKIVF